MQVLRQVLCVAALIGLGACSNGPFSGGGLGGLFRGGLFGAPGDDRQVSLAPAQGYRAPADPRPLVASLSDARLERQPTGILVRARATVPQSRYRGVALVEPRDVIPGTLVLDVRLQGGTGPASATVPVATFIPNARLANVSRIVLRSASGQITLSP